MSDDVLELEHTAAEPAFWNDLENSQKVLQKIKGMKVKLENFKALESTLEDLMCLNEMGMEESDPSVIAEIGDGIKALREKLNTLKLSTLLTGKYDRNNAILTLHAGAGGTEAQDWVQMLLRMFVRWGESHDYAVKMLDFLDGDEAGIKSATVEFVGENAYGFLRSEMGVHRLVRISPFDSSGRRHTSFASVEIMPELDDDIVVEINSEDLRIDTYRASGAGGQHINKTESAVRLTHIPTGVVCACQTERSQHQNKDTAMKMLRSKLFELKEREQKEKIEDLKGIHLEIAWGSQIRSYVFCPYTMVKDHRTNFEAGNVDAVMDGDLDGFINAYLASNSK